VNAEQGKGVMRRMIAHLVLALARRGFHPGVLAARTYNPVWYRMLAGLGSALPGSVFYPRPSAPGKIPSSLAWPPSWSPAPTRAPRSTPASGCCETAWRAPRRCFAAVAPRSGDSGVDGLFHDELGAIDLVLTLLDIRRVPADIRRAGLTSVQTR
jgi:hypothetical protein